MSKIKKTTAITVIVILVYVVFLAAAADDTEVSEDIRVKVCKVLSGILPILIATGYGLALVMLTYGGVRYIYHADDPGGRKEAKSIVVNGIIGAILVTIAYFITVLIIGSGSVFCSGMGSSGGGGGEGRSMGGTASTGTNPPSGPTTTTLEGGMGGGGDDSDGLGGTATTGTNPPSGGNPGDGMGGTATSGTNPPSPTTT